MFSYDVGVQLDDDLISRMKADGFYLRRMCKRDLVVPFEGDATAYKGKDAALTVICGIVRNPYRCIRR